MAEIIMNLDKLSVSLAGRPVLHQIGWEVQQSQRIGLVGPNGAGKSTLLQIMAGKRSPDSGALFRPPGLTVGWLPQEPELPADVSVLGAALAAVPELGTIESKLAELETRMGQPVVYEDQAALARVMRAHERLLLEHERLGGASYQSRVREALARLGLDAGTWEQPAAHLSGGQKKLVLLAQLLVQAPHLLLLDEPDNHLDIPAKRLLEQVIHAYAGCVVIISHDRYLLDEVATHIAELDNGRLTRYAGNYTAYVTERDLRRLRQQQRYAAQQKEIARIEAAIRRFEMWASLVVNERHIRQARSRRKMLDRMDRVEEVSDSRRLSLDLAGWRGSNKVLELAGVTFDLPDGRRLFTALDLTLWHGERVGVVGANGAGKSMLLRLVLDRTAVSAGTVKVGPSIQIGYYAQEHETLNYEQDLITAVRLAAPLSREASVSFLQRFLFSYEQMQLPVGRLSGGERSRLQLALLVLRRPNLLVLDEPTNNLDIAAIEVLEATLEEFEGTILVVSHDRYFLDRTVDRIVALEGGVLRPFLGGYTDYLAEQDQAGRV